MVRVLVVKFEDVIYRLPEGPAAKAEFNPKLKEMLNNKPLSECLTYILRTDGSNDRYPRVEECQRDGVPQCEKHYIDICNKCIVNFITSLCDENKYNPGEILYVDCCESTIRSVEKIGVGVKLVEWSKLSPAAKKPRIFQVTEKTPLLPKQATSSCVIL